jgi:tetratricopeptide (TPR) repeat protein
MIRLPPLLLLTALLPLSGCAYLASFGHDLPTTIEREIAAGEYGKALDTLKWVKPDHPDYPRLMQLQAKARHLARELEKTTLQAADRLEKSGEWYAAQQRYEQALDSLPDSAILQQRYRAFLDRRERYLHKLELALLMNRANWLIQNAPIRTEVARVLPEDYRRYPALRDYDTQIHKTARGLDRCLRRIRSFCLRHGRLLRLPVFSYRRRGRCLSGCSRFGTVLLPGFLFQCQFGMNFVEIPDFSQ